MLDLIYLFPKVQNRILAITLKVGITASQTSKTKPAANVLPQSAATKSHELGETTVNKTCSTKRR